MSSSASEEDAYEWAWGGVEEDVREEELWGEVDAGAGGGRGFSKAAGRRLSRRARRGRVSQPAPEAGGAPAWEAEAHADGRPGTAQRGVRKVGRPNFRGGAPIRAIWVTRFDYKTPEQVATVMRNVADAGFNTVLFQVRGDGVAEYASRVEPWSERWGHAHPGYDPLAVAVEEAHERGLALHAWVNVMPAWRGLDPPTHPDVPWNKHPEWRWYDRWGNCQPLNRGFYVGLNPCLPAVRRHLVSVVEELVGRYEVDGVHLDYIRFPNEHPVNDPTGMEYPRDPVTLELYRRASGGLAPDDNHAAWRAWRARCVTTLVRDMRRAMARIRPAAVLTAAVGPEMGKEGKPYKYRMQDHMSWRKLRLVDGFFPMNYSTSLRHFEENIHTWSLTAPAADVTLDAVVRGQGDFDEHERYLSEDEDGVIKTPAVELAPTAHFRRHRHKLRRLVRGGKVGGPRVIHGMSADMNDADMSEQQLESSVKHSPERSFAVFAYSSLFSRTDDSGWVKQDWWSRMQRNQKLARLLPFLHRVAGIKGRGHEISGDALSIGRSSDQYGGGVAPAPGRTLGRVNRSAWSLARVLALNVRASVPGPLQGPRRSASSLPVLTRLRSGRERRRSVSLSTPGGMLTVASADPRVRGGGLARVKVGWAPLQLMCFKAPGEL